MYQLTPFSSFGSLLALNQPQAMAWIQGNQSHRSISGIARFYSTTYGGVLIDVEVFGLPDRTSADNTAFYGMHIHEFGNCSDEFLRTGNHYNPDNTTHPNHAGDLPPLLSYHNYAWIAFYDKRLSFDDIIGKSLIIHNKRDDFTTQPSGDSGEKIACGVITRIRY